MGGSQSQSAVNEVNNTLIANNTSVNILNENLNNVVVNSIMNEAKTCTAGIFQGQNIVIKGVHAATGSINLNVTQNAASTLSFQCVNVSVVMNQAGNQMLQQIMSNLQTSTSAAALSQMEALAAAAATTGAGAQASGSTSTVNQIINFNEINTTNTNLKNVVQNSIQSNFTSNVVQNCIATVANNQNISIENITTEIGSISTVIDQTTAVNLVTSCVNSTNIGNSVTQSIMSALGISTTASSETELTSSQSGTAESKAESTGPIQDLFNGISNMLNGIFGPLEYASIASSASVTLCCICCCVLLIIMCFGLMMVSMSPAGQGAISSASQTFSDVAKQAVSNPALFSEL